MCTAMVAQPHHRGTTVEGLGALCALFRLSTHALALCGLSVRHASAVHLTHAHLTTLVHACTPLLIALAPSLHLPWAWDLFRPAADLMHVLVTRAPEVEPLAPALVALVCAATARRPQFGCGHGRVEALLRGLLQVVPFLGEGHCLVLGPLVRRYEMGWHYWQPRTSPALGRALQQALGARQVGVTAPLLRAMPFFPCDFAGTIALGHVCSLVHNGRDVGMHWGPHSAPVTHALWLSVTFLFL